MAFDLTEMYKQAFETWRFQVESYWTRNTYFAGFEIAAVAGDWLVSTEHHWTAALGALMAICLTAVWFLSSDRQHEYITYWWEKLVELDGVAISEWMRSTEHTYSRENGGRPVLLASDVERWRVARRGPLVRVRYSLLVLWVQLLFFLLWLYLFGYNAAILHQMHWAVRIATP